MLLKPWDEREKSQMELLHAVQAKLNEIPGVQIFAFNLPSLPGTGEGLPFQFVLNTANDYESLLQVAQRVKQRASESGKFAFLDLDLAFDKPELVVDIDREKAAQMGVSMQDLGVALASLLGEGEINRFTIDGRSYKVIAQVERPYRDNPGWLGSYYVKSRNGQLVALSTLIETHERARPRQLNQFQQLNSAIISGFTSSAWARPSRRFSRSPARRPRAASPSTTPALPGNTCRKAAHCWSPSDWPWRSSSWSSPHSSKASAIRW